MSTKWLSAKCFSTKDVQSAYFVLDVSLYQGHVVIFMECQFLYSYQPNFCQTHHFRQKYTEPFGHLFNLHFVEWHKNCFVLGVRAKAGSDITNRREPRSCLGRVFNFKLGSFVSKKYHCMACTQSLLKLKFGPGLVLIAKVCPWLRWLVIRGWELVRLVNIEVRSSKLALCLAVNGQLMKWWADIIMSCWDDDMIIWWIPSWRNGKLMKAQVDEI